MVGSLEMLSGRSKKEYPKDVEAVPGTPEASGSTTATATNGAAAGALEAVVAM